MKNMNRPAPLCGVSCKLTRRPCKTVQSTHPRGVRHLFEHGHQLRQIISTHAPREGCDQSLKLAASQANQFQSTHPARGATAYAGKQSYQSNEQFQSTHPARGATASAPRASQSGRFQSTHPARGATGLKGDNSMDFMISIHAPREGCDPPPPPTAHHPGDFNPRTPRGVRPNGAALRLQRGYFNPRTPRGVRPNAFWHGFGAC